MKIPAIINEFRAEILPFERAERYIAAICMGIPFFLIIVDSWSKESALQLLIVLPSVLVIPALIAFFYTIRQQKSIEQGAKGSIATGDEKKVLPIRVKQERVALLTCLMMLTVLSGFAGLYFWLFGFDLEDDVKDSISAYVGMNYPHVFGLLLTAASMLFITNGLIYHNKGVKSKATKWLQRQREEGSRSYSVFVGFFLLMLVILPCTEPETVIAHGCFAALFFVCSVLGIFIFCKPEHKWSSTFIAVLSAVGFAIWGINGLVSLPFIGFVDLFWAETFSLWVIGIHYILESFRMLT